MQRLTDVGADDQRLVRLPQGCVVGRRVRDAVTPLRNVVAALGIDFEWHDITPRPVTGTASPHHRQTTQLGP